MFLIFVSFSVLYHHIIMQLWKFLVSVHFWTLASLLDIKPHTHECAKLFANRPQTGREPNAHMCGRDCEPVLRHLQTVCIPFAVNRNLSVFCANTKRTGCARCPFHAPGVLCLPQVCGKLINCAPLMCHMQTAQYVSGALVYARLKGFSLISLGDKPLLGCKSFPFPHVHATCMACQAGEVVIAYIGMVNPIRHWLTWLHNIIQLKLLIRFVCKISHYTLTFVAC